MKRRYFLPSLAVAGGLARRAGAASDKITIALMGVRGRGRALTKAFCDQPDVNVAYVCDVDQNVVGPAFQIIGDSGRKRPPLVSDIRRCLDDKSVDAIVMGTPLHWHACGTILACDAGKDVYVEKPVSHNIREGRLMVEAARRNRRIVQAGTQLRSLPVTRAMFDYVRSGRLGKTLMVKVWNVQLRRNIGHQPDAPVPPGIDYETWTGPLPMMPYNINRFHGTVNWNWHYGAGDIGNDGVHELDLARWLLDVGLPPEISGMGRKLYFDDDQQTPDTMNITFNYSDRVIFYEQRLWNPYMLEGSENGVAVYGDRGVLQFGRFVPKNWSYRVLDEKGAVIASEEHQGGIDNPHARNFLDCVRSRRRPNVDIEEGHLASALAHLGNIVARNGRSIRFDPKSETVTGDAGANQFVRREYRSHWATPKGV